MLIQGRHRSVFIPTSARFEDLPVSPLRLSLEVQCDEADEVISQRVIVERSDDIEHPR